MANKKEPEKEIELEKHFLSLITTDGKEVEIEYELPVDIDNYVLEDIEKALENNEVFNLADIEGIMKFKGMYISELDFKKIIGIRW